MIPSLHGIHLRASLTVDPEVHGAPVLAGDEDVLPGVTPVGLGDGEAVQLSDGHVVEPFLHRELDLHPVPQPATLHIVLVHLELQGRSLFLQNLGKRKECSRFTYKSHDSSKMYP